MRRMLGQIGPVMTVSAALLFAGCNKTPAPAPAAPASNPAAVTTSTSPAPAPAPVPAAGTAPATAPGSGPVVAPVPAPAPSAAPTSEAAAAAGPGGAATPAVVRRVAPAGARVAVTLTETLRASTANVGDGFSGVLAEPISSKGGGVVFAKGTRVAGTVVAAKGRGRFKGAGGLGIELNSIGGVRVSTTEYERAEKGKGKRTGALVGGGAGLGAVIGGLAGGGKGALIGGLAGAGAGTAGAAYTGNKDVVIPSESLIVFRLKESVTR